MTNMAPESSGREQAGDQQADTDAASQRKLARERAEGRDAIGDVAANRNISGSSSEAGDEAFRHAREAIAVKLSRRGVRLTGQETAEDLTEALEAVERFEGAVERGGGDLMVDEPVGGGSPIAPDNAAFVLPQRHSGESFPAFIERIAEATSQAKKQGGASR